MIRRLTVAAALLASLGVGTVRAGAQFATLAVSNFDPRHGEILAYNSAGTPSILFSTTAFEAFWGLAYDASGNLYASVSSGGTGNGMILRFSPTGQNLGTFASIGQPESLAFDASGNLYVVSYDDQAIHKFSPTGQNLGTFVSIGQSSQPEGLAFDASGNLYVANSTVILKFSPTGQALGSFSSPALTDLLGLAFDASGILYASSFNGKIGRFSTSGQDLGVFASTGLYEPWGIAFDAAGNLYAMNTEPGLSPLGGTISQFSPTGQFLGTFANTGLTNPLWLAISIVPEPTSLLMMGSGTTGVFLCGLLRGRKRSRP